MRVLRVRPRRLLRSESAEPKSITMHDPSMVKKRFLKKWTTGLRRCISSSHECTSISERRRIIKLSADLALASVRNGSTRWSRAVIGDALQRHDDKGLVELILGLDGHNSASLISREKHCRTTKRVVITSKKIVKRSRRQARKSTRRGMRNKADLIAKRLVKKRTQLLKELVPGGRDMDDVSLIEETLDYMVWLRAQVDVMRSLARSLPTSRSGE